MFWFLLPVYALIGAFLNRFRGGFLPTGHTQLQRFLFCAGMSLLIYFTTFNWHFALLSLLCWIMGTLSPNHWMQVKTWKEVGEGTQSGLWNTIFIAFLSQFFNFTIAPKFFVVGGLLKGFAYVVASHIPLHIKHLYQGPEVGEALFGAILGICIWSLFLI